MFSSLTLLILKISNSHKIQLDWTINSDTFLSRADDRTFKIRKGNPSRGHQWVLGYGELFLVEPRHPLPAAKFHSCRETHDTRKTGFAPQTMTLLVPSYKTDMHTSDLYPENRCLWSCLLRHRAPGAPAFPRTEDRWLWNQGSDLFHETLQALSVSPCLDLTLPSSASADIRPL